MIVCRVRVRASAEGSHALFGRGFLRGLKQQSHRRKGLACWPCESFGRRREIQECSKSWLYGLLCCTSGSAPGWSSVQFSLRSRHVIPTPVRDVQAHSIFKQGRASMVEDGDW